MLRVQYDGKFRTGHAAEQHEPQRQRAFLSATLEVVAMKSKSLEWRLARLRYIRTVKDQLPMEFHKDIERAERAMLRLVKAALEEQPPTGTLH